MEGEELALNHDIGPCGQYNAAGIVRSTVIHDQPARHGNGCLQPGRDTDLGRCIQLGHGGQGRVCHCTTWYGALDGCITIGMDEDRAGRTIGQQLAADANVFPGFNGDGIEGLDGFGREHTGLQRGRRIFIDAFGSKDRLLPVDQLGTPFRDLTFSNHRDFGLVRLEFWTQTCDILSLTDPLVIQGQSIVFQIGPVRFPVVLVIVLVLIYRCRCEVGLFLDDVAHLRVVPCIVPCSHVTRRPRTPVAVHHHGHFVTARVVRFAPVPVAIRGHVLIVVEVDAVIGVVEIGVVAASPVPQPVPVPAAIAHPADPNGCVGRESPPHCAVLSRRLGLSEKRSAGRAAYVVGVVDRSEVIGRRRDVLVRPAMVASQRIVANGDPVMGLRGLLVREAGSGTEIAVWRVGVPVEYVQSKFIVIAIGIVPVWKPVVFNTTIVGPSIVHLVTTLTIAGVVHFPTTRTAVVICDGIGK